MTMQATLALGDGGKAQVTFNAGAFVAPQATEVCIYNNVAAANYYRDVDVRDAIEKLANAVQEQAAVQELAATPIYFSLALGAGKGAIQVDPNIASIAAGEIGIGVGADVPYTSTERIRTRIRMIRDAMWEAERIYA